MKRSLFKQLMLSALFACSLYAGVPDMREQAAGGGRRAEVSLAASQAGACSFGLYAAFAVRPLSSAVCRPFLSAPPAMALVLSALWPADGVGIHDIDRACIRWEAFPRFNLAAMNVPMDPLSAVLCGPRYRMPLALQASAWPRPLESSLLAGALPWQAGEPGRTLDVAGWSGRAHKAAMIPRLKKIFTQEGVPQQWVWVAEVESALNPQAVSSAGAAGLFQLMPGTARRFGLQTAPVDDRMEPGKSAGAAAQYLKFLRREFGCWSLAFAAYNAGEGRVREIMKKRRARTFSEVERYLPPETRAYVPKVMAIVALREDQLRGVYGAYWMP